jgi:hypothetical protein
MTVAILLIRVCFASHQKIEVENPLFLHAHIIINADGTSKEGRFLICIFTKGNLLMMVL